MQNTLLFDLTSFGLNMRNKLKNIPQKDKLYLEE